MSVELHLFHLPLVDFDSTLPLERQYVEHNLTADGGVGMRYFRYVDPELPLYADTDSSRDGTGDLLSVVDSGKARLLVNWMKTITAYQNEDFHIERNGAQRDEIKSRYMARYMRVLVAALELHLRGDFVCLRYC